MFVVCLVWFVSRVCECFFCVVGVMDVVLFV